MMPLDAELRKHVKAQAASADEKAKEAAMELATAKGVWATERVQQQEELLALQQQVHNPAAAAAQTDGDLLAFRAERGSLLGAQQLASKAIMQQATEAAEGAAGSGPAESHGDAVAAVPPPDLLHVLRDQKEALTAQHEATMAVRSWANGAAYGAVNGAGVLVAAACLKSRLISCYGALLKRARPSHGHHPQQDMKQLMARQQGALQRAQQERNNALADCSFAREEARLAAANQDKALATARAAHTQLQVERDSVMASLQELQAAFAAAEARRTAEMERLRQAAESKQREAEALRAQLEQHATQLQRLDHGQAVPALRPPLTTSLVGTATAPQYHLADSSVCQSRLGQAGTVAQRELSPFYADIEDDVVLQQSLDNSWGSAVAGPLPLQPVRMAAQETAAAAAPVSPAGKQGGWGAGYEKAYLVRPCSACDESCCQLLSHSLPALQGGTFEQKDGTSHRNGGTSWLSGRWLVTQEENGRRFQVDRYERFPSDGSGRGSS